MSFRKHRSTKQILGSNFQPIGWTCSHCKYENDTPKRFCEKCKTPKPYPPPKKRKQADDSGAPIVFRKRVGFEDIVDNIVSLILNGDPNRKLLDIIRRAPTNGIQNIIQMVNAGVRDPSLLLQNLWTDVDRRFAANLLNAVLAREKALRHAGEGGGGGGASPAGASKKARGSGSVSPRVPAPFAPGEDTLVETEDGTQLLIKMEQKTYQCTISNLPINEPPNRQKELRRVIMTQADDNLWNTKGAHQKQKENLTQKIWDVLTGENSQKLLYRKGGNLQGDDSIWFGECEKKLLEIFRKLFVSHTPAMLLPTIKHLSMYITWRAFTKGGWNRNKLKIVREQEKQKELNVNAERAALNPNPKIYVHPNKYTLERETSFKEEIARLLQPFLFSLAFYKKIASEETFETYFHKWDPKYFEKQQSIKIHNEPLYFRQPVEEGGGEDSFVGLQARFFKNRLDEDSYCDCVTSGRLQALTLVNAKDEIHEIRIQKRKESIRTRCKKHPLLPPNIHVVRYSAKYSIDPPKFHNFIIMDTGNSAPTLISQSLATYLCEAGFKISKATKRKQEDRRNRGEVFTVSGMVGGKGEKTVAECWYYFRVQMFVGEEPMNLAQDRRIGISSDVFVHPNPIFLTDVLVGIEDIKQLNGQGITLKEPLKPYVMGGGIPFVPMKRQGTK